jgi:hypothetical protein
MTRTVSELTLTLEARFGFIWSAPLLLAQGWRPLIGAVRPGWNIAMWPIAIWYGLIRPKWLRVSGAE